MRVHQADQEFILNKLPTVEGWLLDNAALFTSALLRHQNDANIQGCAFEIGVFQGKYLSLLYHHCRLTSDAVIGIDTFGWSSRDAVESNFARLFGQAEHLKLITGDSTEMNPAGLADLFDTKPRFISVDGAHTAPAVLHDLTVCAKLLAPGGVLAIDDLLNPRAIGVSEGAYRYFLSAETNLEDALAPFAYCANKLFCSHRIDVDRYREAAWQYTRDNPELQMVKDFNKLLANGRQWVEQELFGSRVVIF